MASLITDALTWVGAVIPIVSPATAKRFVGTMDVNRTLQFDDHTCGVHAVRAVLRHFGQRPSFEALRKELKTTKDGTSQTAMTRCLRKRGIRVGVRNRMGLRDLRDALEDGRVVLAFTDREHVIVVHGMDDAYVYVADSSGFFVMLQRLPRSLFRQRWDYSGLIVSRP